MPLLSSLKVISRPRGRVPWVAPLLACAPEGLIEHKTKTPPAEVRRGEPCVAPFHPMRERSSVKE
jgi:hypothetical protein